MPRAPARPPPAGSDEVPDAALRTAWVGALACFVLAGLTGVLYRFGIGYGVTLGLDLGNVRHAHSHLMYLGWATPALFALIARQVEARLGRAVPAFRWVLGATLAAALAAYPLFLAFGYRPVVLGAARVPLAAVAAGLNMLAWYGFVAVYARATRGVPRTHAFLLWDVSLVFLVAASLGAWGVSLLAPLGVESPSMAAALTHVFLDLFAEGWFVPAVLGLAFAALRPDEPAGHWSLWLVCAGLPVLFALGMPASLVPPPLQVMARAGGILVAAGMLVHVGLLVRARTGAARGLWRVPLVLLALKLLALLVVCLTPGAWWASMHGARLLYLHLMLLGFVTPGLAAAAARTWGHPAPHGVAVLTGAVLLVLVSLIPFTGAWPAAWSPAWAWRLAAWTALGPVLVVAAWGVRRGP